MVNVMPSSHSKGRMFADYCESPGGDPIRLHLRAEARLSLDDGPWKGEGTRCNLEAA